MIRKFTIFVIFSVVFSAGQTFCSIYVAAQTSEKFDIATFTPPTGWEKDSKNGTVTYRHATAAEGYCVIAVYSSQESSGNLKTDFNNHWNRVAVQTFKITNPPETAAVRERNGWNILSGNANFQDAGGNAAFFVQTYTGYNKTLSVAILSDNKNYLPVIAAFLASINLDISSDLNAGNSQLNQSSPVSGSSSSGITKLRTNFSDGWTATVENDYVLVNKGNTNVYLFYGIELNDQTRAYETNKYFWQTVVVPRFNIQTSKELEDSSSFTRTYFVEGTGTDKQTGQFCYIAMRVLIYPVGNGIAKVIVASAPDKQSYYSRFPNPDSLGNMVNSNRFALTSNDVFGYWKDTSSAGLSFYNRDTGNYAGMKTVVSSNEFTFNSNGTYLNNHAGGSYDLETLSTSQSKNGGKFIITNWEMTITDAQGETTIYDAYFEAVKSGRILHLTNKKFTGMQYQLVKIK